MVHGKSNTGSKVLFHCNRLMGEVGMILQKIPGLLLLLHKAPGHGKMDCVAPQLEQSFWIAPR